MPTKGTVWLVSQYEPAPGDAWRPLRNQYLAQCLLSRGYKVVQWSATFNHQGKQAAAEAWEERQVAPDWCVRFVPNAAYESNVGRARLQSEADFAKNFAARALQDPEPPVCIVMREPPSILGEESVRVARKLGCAVICDVIDLWPEFFYRVLPKPVRFLGRLLFSSFYNRRKRVWSSVDGLCTVSQSYLQHAKDVAPHVSDIPNDCIYTSIEFDFVQRLLSAHSKIVDQALPVKPEGEVWVGYAGTMGTGYDMPSLLSAAELLRKKGARIRFVMAGVGPFVPQVEEASRIPESNIVFLGKLAPADLYPMLGKCDMALLCYAAETTVAIPDKFYDCLAAGLPIINSLQGEVKGTIESRQMGLTYAPGDAEDLAAKIELLASDPERRLQMKANAEAAGREWDAPTIFERFGDLVEQAIAHCQKR